MVRSLHLEREELEALARNVMGTAVAHLMRDSYVAFIPMLLTEDTLVPMHFASGGGMINKAKLADMLRVLAPHCKAIIIVAEAWVRRLETTADHKDVVFPVREDPKRQECIAVSAQSPEGDLRLCFTFTRDGQGQPCTPEEVSCEWTAGTQFDPALAAISEFHGLYGRR